jgi:hypothetical protein
MRVEVHKFLIHFGEPIKLVRLIRVCLNETYSKAHIDQHFSDSFPIKNGVKLLRSWETSWDRN